MNYSELITAIKNRPDSFLRNRDLFELDTFLRGVSYSNFSAGNTTDLFRQFKDEWIPFKFENYTHDWVETVIENSNSIEAFDYFFELWREFELTLQ